jgi:hypothetical protein
MVMMPLAGSRLRVLTLMAGAAFTVHQLRYLLTGGEGSGAMSFQEHAYLTAMAPIVAFLVLVAAVEIATRVARADCIPSASRNRQPRPLAAWASATAALLAVYTGQEWLEMRLETGHSAGIASIFGSGGWVVFFLALAAAGVVVLLLRGASAAIERVAERARSKRDRHRHRVSASPRFSFSKPALDVVARFLAGRGPPLPSV